MLNLFKMEIYHALKSKVVAVMLLLTGVISFLNMFVISQVIDENQTVNICRQFTSLSANQMMLIFWAVMISVYIAGEYKNGFVKSIAGQISSRGYLAVSKVLFALAYTVAAFVVSFIFTVIGAFVFIKGGIVLGFTAGMISVLLVQLLVHLGFTCIFILIATLTRSSAFGIGLGIFMGCGMSGMLYSGISWAVNKTGIVKNFNFAQYMIDTNVKNVQIGVPKEFMIRGVIVGLAFVAVFTYASVKALNKRDI